MQPLEPDDPRRIGPFALVGRLGSGGMGRVYLGRSASGRRVAIKCIHRHLLDDDPTFRDRFRREVEAARAVGGFWTPAIVDSDAAAEQPWYASAYVDAPTLHDVVRRDGLLDLGAAAALGAGLAEALAAIHAAHLVHRDLKPSNVLMVDDGPRVIDFGIVRALQGGTALTGTGVRLLSLGYSPPEQMRGQSVTTAGDVFALGAVLVFATAGHLPYPGATEVAVDRRMDRPPDLEGVPGPLRGLLRRCLAVDPGARPSVSELLAAFNALVELDTQPVARRPGAGPVRPTRVDPERADAPGGEEPVDRPRRRPASDVPRAVVHRPAETPAEYGRRIADEAAREHAAPVEQPVAAPVPAPPGPAGSAHVLAGALLAVAVAAAEVYLLAGTSVLVTALIGAVVLIVSLLALARHQGAGGLAHEGGAFGAMFALTIGYGVCAGLLAAERTDLAWWGVGLVAVGVAVVLGFVGLMPPAVLEDSRLGPVCAAGALAMGAGVLLVVLLAWFAATSAWVAFVAAGVLQAVLAVVLARLVSVPGTRPAPGGTDDAAAAGS